MKILQALIDHMGITLPVTVTIKTRKGKDCDAFYLGHYSDRTGKLIGHKITIYTIGATRPFETLLAHELIHAKQEEHKIEEWHGEMFKAWASDIETNFGLQEIFIHDIDTN
jgi:hypothetical protein